MAQGRWCPDHDSQPCPLWRRMPASACRIDSRQMAYRCCFCEHSLSVTGCSSSGCPSNSSHKQRAMHWDCQGPSRWCSRPISPSHALGTPPICSARQDQSLCLSTSHLPCHALLTNLVLRLDPVELHPSLGNSSLTAFDSFPGNPLGHLARNLIRFHCLQTEN